MFKTPKSAFLPYVYYGRGYYCPCFSGLQFFNEANAGIIGKIGEAAEKIGKWVRDKVYAAFFKPNVHCPKQDTLVERYSMCFACMTMKVLLESFMTACSQSYYIVKEAGVKLLLIGTMLWVPFTVIKQVSSLTDPEAPSMVNELGKFTFKVIVAYMFITSGISVLVNLVINPVLATGADFANAFWIPACRRRPNISRLMFMPARATLFLPTY